MKNTFRKAALSTICMLIVAVVSLTGVTYAWFTQGTQATVSDFNVGVEASAGNLMIAQADGNGALTWGTAITPFDTSIALVLYRRDNRKRYGRRTDGASACRRRKDRLF